MNILVIGTGLIGKLVFDTLNIEHNRRLGNVYAADINAPIGSSIMKADATDINNLSKVLNQRNIDMVVLCVPGFIGRKCLENCIECGMDVVDMSFSPECPLDLDKKAKEKGVKVFVDIGLAPGMPGIILGHYNKQTPIKRTLIEVGGVPVEPKAPYYYKAPFSPADVIEEYVRPVRHRVINESPIIEGRPLSYSIPSKFGEKYSAILTDGLRTLLHTKPTIAMRESTTRHKEHIKLMKTLLGMGAFDPQHLKDTSKALLSAWEYEEGEKDKVLYHQLLVDNDDNEYEYMMEDIATDTDSAMARTTGYVTTAVVNLLQDNYDSFKNGIICPDHVGEVDGSLSFILNYLKDKGIIYKRVK